MGEWTRRYFDIMYLRRWRLGLPDDEVRLNVGFLAHELGAKTGDSLLDVACGQGRYSLAFAERGLAVVGLDASEPLLAEAQRLGAVSGLKIEWVHGDMRDLPYKSQFDHAVLLDSFGFFDQDAENAGILVQLAKVLRPGGRIGITLVNGEWILANFESSARENVGGGIITIHRELDRDSRILRETFHLDEGDRSVTAERRQRLYSGDELAAMARRTTLEVEALYGSFGGAKYDPGTSPKIILIARRSGGGA